MGNKIGKLEAEKACLEKEKKKEREDFTRKIQDLEAQNESQGIQSLDQIKCNVETSFY